MLALLSFPLLLGIYGLHRVYLRDYWWGLSRLGAGVFVAYEIGWNDNLVNGKGASIAIVLVLGLYAILIIWSFVDFILAVAGMTKDANGLLIRRWW
jgi:hypothetical protein